MLAELIQAGGETLLSAIHKLFHSVWNKEELYDQRMESIIVSVRKKGDKKKFHDPSPRANYTDRTTASCRRSDCQLLRIEGATWSA
jgi:hypothetical protein